MKISKVFPVLLIVAGSLFSCSRKNQQFEKSVRIAIQPSAAFVPLYVVRYTQILERTLKPKKINVIWQDFESGPPINESLSAELSDIGVLGDVPSVLVLSGSIPMKLVGIPARGSDAYALLARRNDNSFSSYKDLKGKRIATVFGSTGHFFTKNLLEKSSLSFSDIEFLNISASSADYFLYNEETDGVVIWEPNVTRLINSGYAKIITQGSEININGTNCFIVREDFLNDNEEIVRLILSEYAKAARMLPSNSDFILQRIANDLNINYHDLLMICNKYDYSTKVQADDIKSLQETIKFLVSIDNLAGEYNVQDYVTDLSSR